jgi:hypothetical protein
VTKPSKYFPPQTPCEPALTTSNAEYARTLSREVTVETLQRAGIISSDPNAKKAKPAGSSPALRIACPVCRAAAGALCTKTELVRSGGVLAGSRQVTQTIAHKKRREEEERTR